MAILSSPLLLRTHALLLVTTAYFLLFSPLTLLQSAPLYILGEAMHVRPALLQPDINPLTGQTTPTKEETAELLGLVTLVLVAIAVIEMVFAGGLMVPGGLKGGTASARARGEGGSKARLGEELHTTLSAQGSWLSLAFVHVFAAGGLAAWIYLFHSSRNLLSTSTSSKVVPGSLGAILGNQVVFSAALIDMLFWGYVWTVIREERREVLQILYQFRED